MPESAVILVDYDNVRLIREERTAGDVASNLADVVPLSVEALPPPSRRRSPDAYRARHVVDAAGEDAAQQRVEERRSGAAVTRRVVVHARIICHAGDGGA